MTKILSLITLGLTLFGCHATPKAEARARPVQLNIRLLVVDFDYLNNEILADVAYVKPDVLFEIDLISAALLSRSADMFDRAFVVPPIKSLGVAPVALSPWHRHKHLMPPEVDYRALVVHANAAMGVDDEIDLAMIIKFVDVAANTGIEHLHVIPSTLPRQLREIPLGIHSDHYPYKTRIRGKIKAGVTTAMLLSRSDARGFPETMIPYGHRLMLLVYPTVVGN